jgi:type VI secretion system protein ImpA
MLADALHRWPATIHPQPIVEGQLDLGVRANALAALADPDGLLGDVRDIAVVSGATLGLTVREVERALAVPRRVDALNPQSVTRQLAELRANAADDDMATVNLLARATRHVRSIDAWSREFLGDQSPSLHELSVLLAPFVSKDGSGNDARPLVAVRADGATQPNGRALRRSPDSACERDRALQEIRNARQWFEGNEPSSPVAVLLKQAERMVGKRFSEIADTIPLELLRKWEEGFEDSHGRAAA